jgi:membrane associated rhomboid family serine protease
MSDAPLQNHQAPSPDGVRFQHCYRHPNRETGVRCAICGRPICYECMTSAPVGFHCPECLAEQRRSEHHARTIARAQTRARWRRGVYLGHSSDLSATKVLIALNVLVFLVELVVHAASPTLFGSPNPSALHRMGALAPYDVLVNHQYWRMFTVMFLHLDLIHIALNMWALWILGEFVEEVVGHLKFVLVVAAPPASLTAGASGAIFGLFGALALYAYVYRNRDFAARAILGQIVFWLVINLAFTFGVPGISWEGHIGGLFGGAAVIGGYMFLGRKSPHGRFTHSDLAVTVGVAAVLFALTFLRVDTFTAAAILPRP